MSYPGSRQIVGRARHQVCRTGGWLAIGFLLILSSSVCFAASPSDEQLYDIDIPALNAALALNRLAEQTGAILLFPYDLAEARQANALKGRYTLMDALDSLLQGSGLSGGLSDKRAIQITLDEVSERNNEEGSMAAEKVPFSKKFAALFASVFFATGSVGAQTNEAGEEYEFTIEEVIVTATRRETGIQTTAVSISAFSGAKLEEFGKTNLTQFIDAVPGVTSVDAGGGSNRIIFRNIATSTQEAGSATSATYFDDFALNNPGRGMPEIRLVDMERVEVLKGPQGTLFGRSAMGGIVRYISNKPNTEEVLGGFNGYLSSTTDGGNNYGGHGYFNYPISESLAVRVVAYTYQNDGFIDNVELGVKDVNDEDTKGARIALHWDATEKFSLDLTYLNQSTESAFSDVTTTRDPGDLDVAGDEGPDVPFDIDTRTSIAGTLNEHEPDYELLNLKLEYDFNTFTTTFLATRINTELGWVFDEREYVDLRAGTLPDLNGSGDSGFPSSETETDVLELRLVSSSDGFLDWIAGLYYEDSKTDYQQFTTYFGPPGQVFFGFIPVFEGMPPALDSVGETTGHEEAFYGELGLNFTADTRLLLGYRRSDVEYGTLTTQANGFFEVLTGSDLLVGMPFDTQEDVNTYKLSLEHTFTEDIFGYALASSGYRRGGFNLPNPFFGTPLTTFDSDTLWNYEIGMKSTWLDGRLVANVSAYLLKYDDIQLTVQDPVTFNRTTENVGKADIPGIELGVQYLMNENLSFGFAGSLSNPELKEDVPGGVSGKKGDRLPGSANESFSFTINYDRPLSNGMGLFASAFYRYVGDRLNDFNLDLDVKLPSYSLTDLRLGINHPKGWSVALFADNVFDEAIIYNIDRQGPFFESVPTNRPRTVGLNFIYNYR